VVVSASIFANRAKFRVILDREPIRAFLRVFRNPEKDNGGQDGEIGDAITGFPQGLTGKNLDIGMFGP